MHDVYLICFNIKIKIFFQ